MWEVITFDRCSSGSKKYTNESEAWADAMRAERIGDGVEVIDPKGKVVYRQDCW